MGRVEKLPWWSAFPVSIGVAGMSAFAGTVIPQWLQLVLFGLSAGLAFFGAASACWHFFRCRPPTEANLDRHLHEEGPLPGSTTCLVLRVNDARVALRRVIWEISTKQGAVVSLSLTGANAFALAVTDVRGQSYAVDIPLGSDGLPLGKLMYLLVEVGTATNYSFLRLSLNGAFYRGRAIPHGLDLGDHEWRIAIGADGGGRNNAAVDFFATVMCTCILNAVDRANLAAFFAARMLDFERGVAMSFDGLSHSMQSDINRDLIGAATLTEGSGGG